MTQERYIKVKVKTRSQRDWVENKEGAYLVHTKKPARDNKANFAVIDLLSDYLDIPKSNLSIKHGLKNKTKTIYIVVEKED
jgi:uncharacterized protein YggU (UPF0235/DUF167 family)